MNIEALLDKTRLEQNMLQALFNKNLLILDMAVEIDALRQSAIKEQATQ